MAIITTTNLKAYVPGTITDSVDDTVLDWVVAAANQAVIDYCGGRTFEKVATGSASARVYDAVCQPFRTPSVMPYVDVDDFWETTVLVVKTDDNDDGTYETTWTLNTDFILEPLNGLVGGVSFPYSRIRSLGTRSFPTLTRRPGVQVTAAWGWTAVPAGVTLATLMHAHKLFGRRNSPEGVLGGFQDFTATRISRYDDPDVANLLGPYTDPEGAASFA